MIHFSKREYLLQIAMLLLTILFYASLLLFTASCQKCVLPYVDFPTKEPVFLKSDLTLIEPNVSAITLNDGEEIYVACPGKANYLLITSTPLEKATCVQNSTLKIGAQNYILSNLNCSKAVAGETLISSETCGNGRGVFKYIGHNITGKFLNLFKVCYDDFQGEALFTEHTIYGAAINFAKKESTRPSFKVPGLSSGLDADTAYKQTTEKATFATILQSSALADYYINTTATSYLSRGHLSPDADSVYVSSQFSTYFYINTMPQWQVVNNGNWKIIESLTRGNAAIYNTNFKIWTGGFDILQIKDVNGMFQYIFLSNLKLPVPKFTWKVIQDEGTSGAIAFVTVNNPFIERIGVENVICPDICGIYGWSNSAFSNPAKGYTYCCDVNILRTVIPTIPFVNYTNILINKN